MDGTQGDRKRQHLRATAITARAMYRELRRASYTRHDVLRFVNELMELLTKDKDGEASEQGQAAPALVDPESGLPDADVTLGVLQFELQHRRPGGTVVVAIDVGLPSWCSGEARRTVHGHLGRLLRRHVRGTDCVGRLTSERFCVILPGATVATVDALRAKLEESFGQEEGVPAEMRLELRSVEAGDERDARVLLGRCLDQATVPIVPRVRLAARSTPELVLALGGGAARAVGHVGVLQALARRKVKIRGVAGASAGALIGAMHAQGAEPGAILERFLAFASSPIYRRLRRAYATYSAASKSRNPSQARFFRESSLAFFSETVLSAVPQDLYAEFIEFFVGPDRDIESLGMPFAVSATDLIEGRPVTLSYGSLHSALASACAVPGLFPPQPSGDRLLVDGSPITEVPIEAAQSLVEGAPVLAVYLERPRRRVPAFTTSAEVVTRIHALLHTELVREQVTHASLLLPIPVKDIGWLDFREARRTAEIGEATAEQTLDDLLARLGMLEELRGRQAP